MAEFRPDAFSALAVRLAGEHDIALPAADLAVRPDPAGAARFLPRPPDGDDWPGDNWLPINMLFGPDGPVVDWQCFAGIATDTPFFSDAMMQARAHPFNQRFAWRMHLSDLVARAPGRAAPAGFIFHLSRCGSTLVHSMLATSGEVRSMAEVPTFDSALQFCQRWDGAPEIKFRVLRSMAAALAGDADAKPLVLKLDAWHVLSWPLLRAAFPETPSVFLYRKPADILVSQQRLRGSQAVPDPGIAALCGLSDYTGLNFDEYCAEILAASCRMAEQGVRAGALRAVNYQTLPEAVFDRVLPLFGLAPGEAAMARMREVARFHAKAPERIYVPDSAEKELAAGEQLRALAERVVGPAYRALDMLAG